MDVKKLFAHVSPFTKFERAAIVRVEGHHETEHLFLRGCLLASILEQFSEHSWELVDVDGVAVVPVPPFEQLTDNRVEDNRAHVGVGPLRSLILGWVDVSSPEVLVVMHYLLSVVLRVVGWRYVELLLWWRPVYKREKSLTR